MGPRKFIRFGATILLLGTVGILAGIGIFALVFAWTSGRYAPSGSSDLAAWIQAVGSVAAIFVAFALGERQARKARDHAIEVQTRHTARVEDGVQSVISQLDKEIDLLRRSANDRDYADFVIQWNLYQKATLAATLAAFDRLPLHELGHRMRIHYGFELRGVAELAFNRVNMLVNENLENDDKFATEATLAVRQRHQLKEIRTTAEAAFAGLKGFRERFDRA